MGMHGNFFHRCLLSFWIGKDWNEAMPGVIRIDISLIKYYDCSSATRIVISKPSLLLADCASIELPINTRHSPLQILSQLAINSNPISDPLQKNEDASNFESDEMLRLNARNWFCAFEVFRAHLHFKRA
jgi:hypothetical protein